jgi:hypothetical protein
MMMDLSIRSPVVKDSGGRVLIGVIENNIDARQSPLGLDICNRRNEKK